MASTAFASSRKRDQVFAGLFPDGPPDTHSNTTFCTYNEARVALAGGKLFIDGGLVNLQDSKGKYVGPDLQATRLLWYNLEDLFKQAGGPHVKSAEKPPDIPNLSIGRAFVPDVAKPKFYAFGGMHYPWRDKSGVPVFPDPRSAKGLATVFSYDAENAGEKWKLEDTPDDLLLVRSGASTTDPNTGIGYYVGGLQNENTTPALDAGNRVVTESRSNRNTVSGLLRFDPKDLSWKNETAPNPTATRSVDGYLHYLPLGKKGVLVKFGGTNKIVDDAITAESHSDKIDIYDISSGIWHVQPTSSHQKPPPLGLSQGCSVAMSANGTHNIYVYGGLGNLDIWVLSLPSFTWIKVWKGTEVVLRHQCAGYQKYMLSIGGRGQDSDKTCNNGKGRELLRVFDTASLTWDPLATSTERSPGPYQVPKLILDAVGNRTSPSDGWSSESLEAVFTGTLLPTDESGSGSISDIDTPRLPTARPGLNVGAITGGAIGGVLGLLLIGGMLWWYISTRRWNWDHDRERGPRELDSQLVSPGLETPKMMQQTGADQRVSVFGGAGPYELQGHHHRSPTAAAQIQLDEDVPLPLPPRVPLSRSSQGGCVEEDAAKAGP